MGGSTRSLLHLYIFFLYIGFASSSFISNEVFEAQRSVVGRSLLQQKTACTLQFDKLNYTIITSQCKGPNYSKDRCCKPLKVLACPHVDQLNDLKTNCADTFFSYLNLYGKYPPGVFAALCTEGKQGLKCDDYVPPPQPSNRAPHPYHTTLLLMAGLPLLVSFYMY